MSMRAARREVNAGVPQRTLMLGVAGDSG